MHTNETEKGYEVHRRELKQVLVMLCGSPNVARWIGNNICGALKPDDVRRMFKSLGPKSSLSTSGRHECYKNLANVAEGYESYMNRTDLSVTADKWFTIKKETSPERPSGADLFREQMMCRPEDLIRHTPWVHTEDRGSWKRMAGHDDPAVAYAAAVDIATQFNTIKPVEKPTFNLTEYTMKKTTLVTIALPTAAFASTTVDTVFGTPVDSMDEQQLFSAVTRIKADIATLHTLDIDSKAVKAKVKALEAAIESIVSVIDALGEADK